MTVLVALTFDGGAVVGTDSRRMDVSLIGGFVVGSDRFPKTFRRDWDHPSAPNSVHRLVIGGVCGQLLHRHLRLTAAIEDECSIPVDLPQLQARIMQMMGNWIAPGNPSDIVLVSSYNLNGIGQPNIVHLSSVAGATPVVVPTQGSSCVLGSGAAWANQSLVSTPWSDLPTAIAAAETAVRKAIQNCGSCGGNVSLETWP
jgi:hypothetical protein